ncbi:MAG TPA: NADH-quinone oxidoreductase subunit N [Anaerolineae bacterium]|nr:NADH-quinone oxidoreductase subunit N [Anaerolineae bacterium]
MFGSINTSMILAILPEIMLFILAGFVFVFDLVWDDSQRRNLGWISAGGFSLIIMISLMLGTPGSDSGLVWGGMLRHDWLGFAFKMLFLFGATITALFAMDVEDLGKKGEFYLLLIFSTLGMTLMASSSNLIMLYLSIEATSLPLYILAGFFKDDDKSTEAGFKYFLFGAMASAIMLYGFSLLYGFSGTTDLDAIAGVIKAGGMNPVLLVGTLLMILVGFGFKISAVPFHFWAPDVYEGAPTVVAGFLSTASKAAGFTVLIRVLLTSYAPASDTWMMVLAIISTLTMTLGNTLALAQKNIKRLLAYSSIAHAGYILIGVVAISELGITGSIFYIIVYLITNLAAFGIVSVVGRITGSDEISAYDGLSRRSPWLGLAMLVVFLSLAGMPPFGGFIVKVLVLASAVKAKLFWLAFVGILNSIIGLYYYLIVLKHVYLYRSENEQVEIPVTRPYAIGLIVLTIGIILLGVVISPWFNVSTIAAKVLF